MIQNLHCLNFKRDALDAYAKEWLRVATFSMMNADPCDLMDYGNAQTAVLDRSGKFQVELCVFRGGVLIPAHVHPRMNSIEVSVAGAVRFHLNGREIFPAEMNDEDLVRFARGKAIRFESRDVHGGKVLPCGAVFLSIQRWEGEPSSVGLDYEGAPVSEQHRETLQCR